MAPKLFTGLWKVALGLLETSLAGYELPPKEFETASAVSSVVLPPRTGMLRASVGMIVVMVGEGRERGRGGEKGRVVSRKFSYKEEDWLEVSDLSICGIVLVEASTESHCHQSWHGKVSRHLLSPPMAQPTRSHPQTPPPYHKMCPDDETHSEPLCDYIVDDYYDGCSCFLTKGSF